MSEVQYKTKKRQSNFELLRIIAMFMVLILHTEPQAIQQSHIAELWIWNLFHYICIIAVDLFVFISGYFGIRSTPRSFLKFLIPPIVYTIILGLLVGEPTLRIPPFFTSPWWFVNAYFLLMLFAPFLNIVIENTNKKQHLFFVLGVSFLNIWQGFLQQQEGLVSGFTIVNFINIYVFAQYYKKYGIGISAFQKKYINLLLFLLLFLVAITIYVVKFHAVKYVMLGLVNYYNSPLVLFGAFLVFTTFEKIQLKSSCINWIASSSFSVYLISNFYFFRECWYKPFWAYIDKCLSDILGGQVSAISHMVVYMLVAICINICIFIVCILIDKLRGCMTNGLEIYLSNKIVKILKL